MRIGAATPIQRFLDHPALIETMPGMPQCAIWFADNQIRESATVGGNVVNASPAADCIPPLLTHNAVLELMSRTAGGNERRNVPLAQFLRGPRSHRAPTGRDPGRDRMRCARGIWRCLREGRPSPFSRHLGRLRLPASSSSMRPCAISMMCGSRWQESVRCRRVSPMWRRFCAGAGRTCDHRKSGVDAARPRPVPHPACLPPRGAARIRRPRPGRCRPARQAPTSMHSLLIWRRPMTDLSIQVTVNGRHVTRTAKPHQRLLDFLREDLHLTGAKEGCGAGECGTCSVFVDGKLVKSCLVPIAKVQGAKIETVEGLSRSGEYDRAAEGVSQDRRQSVRLLHSRHGDGRDRRTARQSGSRRRGDQGTARRQHLPLHRVPEDIRGGRARARRARRPKSAGGARRGRRQGRKFYRRQCSPYRRAEQSLGRA